MIDERAMAKGLIIIIYVHELRTHLRRKIKRGQT
jgi:hypothetical protein